MIDLLKMPSFALLPLCFLGGLIAGYGFFGALHKMTNLIVKGGNPALGLALALGRFALVGGVFYLAVQAGGIALLVTLAGFLLAKTITLRRVRKISP